MLSSFSPLSLFGRGPQNSLSATWVRKGLVVAQFAASIILMIATFVFYRLLQFVQENNLGYNAEQVIAISTQGAENVEQINSLLNTYQGLIFVSDLARAQSYPGAGARGRTLSKDGQSEEGISLQTNRATPEILETLGIKLLAGKTLTENISPKIRLSNWLSTKPPWIFWVSRPKKLSAKLLITPLVATVLPS